MVARWLALGAATTDPPVTLPMQSDAPSRHARSIRPRRPGPPLTVLAAALALGSTGCASGDATEEDSLLATARLLLEPLPPLAVVADSGDTRERVALGWLLFFEPRLSVDGTVSCASCHAPERYGADGRARSIGVEDRPNARNAPTVLNAALQVSQHWGGERMSLADQAFRSLLGPASFGNPDHASVMRRIRQLPGYTERFAAAFPQDAEPVTAENLAEAIAAYERTLLTPAPFDDFLSGDAGGLSPLAREGLDAFLELGCVACHTGPALGGQRYQRFGVVEPYWRATAGDSTDVGRFAMTGDEQDRYLFKVPPLRNVSETAPYFHDGSVALLDEAVRVMARVQLGIELDDTRTAALVAFLESLTGPLPIGFAVAPELPPDAAGMPMTEGRDER